MCFLHIQLILINLISNSLKTKNPKFLINQNFNFQVAAHTAQLMVACRVKSDPDSHGMRRLQSAGHAVRVATERLVKEASDKAAAEDERLLVISDRMVSGIAQVSFLCWFLP